MDWIAVLREDELPDGERRVVEVHGRPILVLHHQGQVYAVDNVCPHMGAALDGGEVTDDGTIVCPRHHSAFELRTGNVTEWAPWPPGVGRILGGISPERPLPVFATRIKEGSIWVGLPESP